MPLTAMVHSDAAVGAISDPRTQVGPMARFVGDLALVLQAIAGAGPLEPDVPPVRMADPAAVVLRGLRAAVHTENEVAAPTPDTRAAVEAAAEALSHAGAQPDELRLPAGGHELTREVWASYSGRMRSDEVAWRPGSRSRVVAHLPSALRYAAVTAVGNAVVIAGGSLPNGTASAAVLEYTPATGRVARVARLPAPTTHAAAAALGEVACVIGGRGAAVGSPTDRLVALDVRSGRILRAGRLSTARSDVAAVTVGSRILLAGGRGDGGTEEMLSELVPMGTSARASRAVVPDNVFAYDRANMLAPAARAALPPIYVPNSQSGSVDVIDPRTDKIVEHFPVGALPQHVTPAYDLRTLYVTNDLGNSLTPIDPLTGMPGKPIPVDDPYNLYFTPDGRYAIVVAERFAGRSGL